jgi:hypothetical protein
MSNSNNNNNNNNNGETEAEFDRRTKGAQRLFTAVTDAASYVSGSRNAAPHIAIINRLIREVFDINIKLL